MPKSSRTLARPASATQVATQVVVTADAAGVMEALAAEDVAMAAVDAMAVAETLVAAAATGAAQAAVTVEAVERHAQKALAVRTAVAVGQVAVQAVTVRLLRQPRPPIGRPAKAAQQRRPMELLVPSGAATVAVRAADRAAQRRATTRRLRPNSQDVVSLAASP